MNDSILINQNNDEMYISIYFRKDFCKKLLTTYKKNKKIDKQFFDMLFKNFKIYDENKYNNKLMDSIKHWKKTTDNHFNYIKDKLFELKDNISIIENILEGWGKKDYNNTIPNNSVKLNKLDIIEFNTINLIEEVKPQIQKEIQDNYISYNIINITNDIENEKPNVICLSKKSSVKSISDNTNVKDKDDKEVINNINNTSDKNYTNDESVIVKFKKSLSLNSQEKSEYEEKLEDNNIINNSIKDENIDTNEITSEQKDIDNTEELITFKNKLYLSVRSTTSEDDYNQKEIKTTNYISQNTPIKTITDEEYKSNLLSDRNNERSNIYNKIENDYKRTPKHKINSQIIIDQKNNIENNNTKEKVVNKYITIYEKSEQDLISTPKNKLNKTFNKLSSPVNINKSINNSIKINKPPKENLIKAGNEVINENHVDPIVPKLNLDKIIPNSAHIILSPIKDIKKKVEIEYNNTPVNKLKFKL